MSSVPAPSTGEEKVLAGIAYAGIMLLWVPTILIYLLKKDASPFVKFHCLQALGFIVLAVVQMVLGIASGIMATITGGFSAILTVPVLGLLGLAVFIYWLVIMIKAFMGDTMEIPYVAGYIKDNLLKENNV